MTRTRISPKHSSDKEGFAARWSRRKQQNQHEQKPSEAEIEQVNSELIEVEKDDIEQLKAEKLAALNTLQDEDMPDISALDEDSDFSQFMSINVSEDLRNLALRKLFHGAGYNVRDGLDEYDGDYTHFEKLDPNTITADMKHRLEVEAQRRKAAQLQAEAEEAIAQETASDETSDPIDETEIEADDSEDDSHAQALAVDQAGPEQPPNNNTPDDEMTEQTTEEKLA